MEPSSTSTCPRHRCEQVPVLLIDDDRSFRYALAANLRDDGHRVEDCGGPEETPPLPALAGIRIVITDDRRRSGDGVDFAERFHRVYPRVPVLVVTAFPSDRLEGEVADRPYMQLMSKPIDYEKLHQVLHQLEDLHTT
jgi:two-component system response regulator PilR (NtrC family)